MDVSTYERFRADLTASIWRDLAPFEETIEATEQLPYDRLLPLLNDMRAFSLLIPTEYGGLGLTMGQYLPIIGEFAKVHGGIRGIVHVHNSITLAFYKLADDRQRQQIMPGTPDVRHSVAIALTEPNHGTGKDIGTTARRDGDSYVLNGHKWLISNSDLASHFMVFALTDTDSAPKVSTFMVHRDAPGLIIEPMPELMGCKGGQHGHLSFTDVRVPASSVLGEVGDGIEKMVLALENSRVYVAASSLGVAERALELSIDYAKQRHTFGRPIAERQAVQRYLAEMAVDVYALRRMLADAADKADHGQRIPMEAAMCKIFGLEAVTRVTDRALLVHGGVGYTRGHSIDRLYRDARLNWLEEGTPTIQQSVIAQHVLAGELCMPHPDSVRPSLADTLLTNGSLTQPENQPAPLGI